MPDPTTPSVVLFSSGLDSAVLLAEAALDGPVLPVYISVGFAWEPAERDAAAVLLRQPVFAKADIGALAVLRLPVEDVYPPSHWAVRGTPPAYDTPDEDVYLVGRNLVLLAKAGLYAASQGAGRIVLGPLAGNPFPDARPEFFEAMGRALSLGLDRPIAIAAPLADRHKDAVIRRGIELGVPLQLTLSCMAPVPDPAASATDAPEPRIPLHCGACSKCRERRQAFDAAGVPDPTRYAEATPPSRG